MALSGSPNTESALFTGDLPTEQTSLARRELEGGRESRRCWLIDRFPRGPGAFEELVARFERPGYGLCFYCGGPKKRATRCRKRFEGLRGVGVSRQSGLKTGAIAIDKPAMTTAGGGGAIAKIPYRSISPERYRIRSAACSLRRASPDSLAISSDARVDMPGCCEI